MQSRNPFTSSREQLVNIFNEVNRKWEGGEKRRLEDRALRRKVLFMITDLGSVLKNDLQIDLRSFLVPKNDLQIDLRSFSALKINIADL